jgi:hypothetical protein
VRESPRIDEDPLSTAIRSLSDPIDEITLVIALTAINDNAKLFGISSKPPMNILECFGAVDAWLAPPKPI